MIPLRKLSQSNDDLDEDSHDPLLAESDREEDLRLSSEDFFDDHLHETSLEPDKKGDIDPFVPFDDLPPEDRNILTLRAIVVGLFCGGLVNASNIYLGLKSGWTDSANIFGSIVGFYVLKNCSKWCQGMPILGGDFGPRENNIVQTVATVRIPRR